MQRNPKFCDGVARRDVLRLGAAGLFGLGLNLPQLLAGQALAAKASSGAIAKRDDLSLIIVFLRGGLSTIDTFDMKPNAPSDVRGTFDPVSTNIPGTQICDQLPRVGQIMDKFSIIRSFTHSDSGHGPADHYMLTGYLPGPGFNAGMSPNNQRPSHGSIVAHKLGARGPLPPYVCLPTMHPSCGSSYLGANAAPFVIDADPSAADFSVPDLAPPLTVAANRLNARKEMLAQIDRYQRSAEVNANRHVRTMNVFREKALDLMTSSETKAAFDIQTEPEKMREQYGRHTLGQSCLMARRLVEAGVRCVTVEHQNWDTHDQNFRTLKDSLLPQLDTSMSALYTDLEQRGLLERTLVVVTGEFGRTPRINPNAGRDHWGPCFTVALGGGGLQGGRVIGSSDAWAQAPADNPYGPEDLAATMYQLLGIDPREEFHTPEGRPVSIVGKNGRIIKELL
jgi:uncharacterized protein (DUF1501 family)